MHPTTMQDVARYRQADLRREAARVRLAHEVSAASDEQPRTRLNLTWRRRAISFGRPVLGP